MPPLKKHVTNDDKQLALGREVRFYIKARPEKDLLHVACYACGHEFLVREREDNYNFLCIPCGTNGNLPGLLAREVDNLDLDTEKKEELIAEIRKKYQPK